MGQMKIKNKVISIFSMALCLGIAACQDATEIRPVCGTLDSPLSTPSELDTYIFPQSEVQMYPDHAIMKDTMNAVSVWRIGDWKGETAEEYGIVVVKNGLPTVLPNIRNTRQPNAFYDSATGDLWLSASAMEGTGVHVEQLLLIRFAEDSAFVAATADPYDLQELCCQQMTYSTAGEQITFYLKQDPVTTVTNSVTDMGGFDDEAIWIGEQLSYDLNDKQPRVSITPGLKFVTGLVLTYDDMPTFTADVVMSEAGELTINDLLLKE